MNKLQTEIHNYLYIIAGSFITAIGVVGFLVPNKIATGGTAGLSIVLHHVFNMPTGILMLLINIPLLSVSVKYLGKKFALRTIIALLCIAIFIDLLAEIFLFPALSENTLLATLYGGVAIGIGLGLIFKGDASAGGGTVIAKILHTKMGVKPATVNLIFDSIVIIATGIVFQNIELALWSMIGIYVTSKFIDLILTGRKQNKIVHIASTNLEKLNTAITQEMGITGTLLKGDDLHYNNHRNIIFLSINKNRIIALKNLVEKHDANAYMIVLEASELLGSSRKL